MMKRRQFLVTSLAAAAVARKVFATAGESPRFATRGVVLYPFDLTLTDWPARVARAGLNTIGLHAVRRLDVLVKFVQSDMGQKFLEQCGNLHLHVEYELHAMGDLLSREYFGQDETMFRLDASGQRNADFNCCPSHPRHWS